MTRTRRFGLLRRAAARRSRPQPPGPGTGAPRLSLLLLSLPGLAAVAALLFTWLQTGQTGQELRIAEQGQITTRFNAAIGNLGSGSMDVRLGGIYALERIMRDSPPDQPAVVSVVSAYVRRHAPLPASGAAPPADVDAAMKVLVRRRPERDAGTELDLSRTALARWKPTYTARARSIDLTGAILTGSDLSGADLAEADMVGARLDGARLAGTRLDGAKLTRVSFQGSDLAGAYFEYADLRGVGFGGADLRATHFTGADLTRAVLCWGTDSSCAENVADADFTTADLTGARLAGLDLRKAVFCKGRDALVFTEGAPTDSPVWYPHGCGVLRGADLAGADLSGNDLRKAVLAGALLQRADLSGSDLREADLTGADLTGAVLTGARLDGAVLTGAKGMTRPAVTPLPPAVRPSRAP